MIRDIPSPDLSVYVVWEPILPADWRRPTTRSLARIPDSRVTQLWDPHHLIADELRRAVESNGQLSKPSCCVNHDHFWDMAAIFPPGARANGTLPSPVFFDGEVVGQESAFRTTLKEILSSQVPRGQP